MSDPREATDELMQAVYDELRARAAEHLRHERPEHTLQPTALVHEAYVRLSELGQMRWRDRTHFFGAAAGVLRRVLVDHARARATVKRGDAAQRITLSAVDGDASAQLDTDLLALDEALLKLARLHGRKARVVELRWFGGLSIEAAAEALEVSTTTVENDWAFARAWLQGELEAS
jgi:RNA polymerase sigma factor (TIGR02999 family)